MPLQRRVIAAYAGVALTSELMATFWGLYALHYLTDDAGLEPLYTGILVIVYRVWDAFNDLLIGHLSDNTTSARWGKRRGWMLGGILPYVITYTLFWWVPFLNRVVLDISDSTELHYVRQAILFVYYLVILAICDAGFTAVSVAYLALLGELTDNTQEKFSLNLWRSILGGIGSILSVICAGVLALPAVEIALFDGQHLKGWVYLALVYSTLYSGSVIWCVFQTKGIDVLQNATRTTGRRRWWQFFGRMRQLMQYKNVRLSVWIWVATATAVQFSLACLAYFFLDLLEADESAMAMVILTALACAVLTGIVIKAAFSTSEKRSILRIGLLVWCTFYFVLPFITQFSWRLYPTSLIIGIGLGISMVIPYAMVADTADYIDYVTEERQDGILLGMLQFFNKLLLGVLILVFQGGLHFTGFEHGQPLSTAAEYMIRGGLFLPVLLIYGAFWANSHYELTTQQMATIREELQVRRSSIEFKIGTEAK